MFESWPYGQRIKCFHTQSIETVKHCPKALAGRGKLGKNSGLETGSQSSYQRSWKNSRLEKRNIGENSCLRTGTLTDFKKDAVRIPD
jgi:hypothetical protein